MFMIKEFENYIHTLEMFSTEENEDNRMSYLSGLTQILLPLNSVIDMDKKN